MLSLYGNENTTVQWSIAEESMLMTTHAKGRHGYGGIWGGRNASFLHNLIAHNFSRNPRFPSNEAVPNIVELTNNVIYNWGLLSTYGSDAAQYNLNNNYYKYGPNTYYHMRNIFFSDLSAVSKMYLDGNIMDGDAKVTADNWLGVKGMEDASSKLTQPVQVIGGYVAEPAQDAYKHVLLDAGATLPKRDAVDFVMQDLTVENDAGLTAGQAVALHTRGDRQIFRNVRLVGFQDTLLTNGTGRQYYVDSYIDGSVDFIFGSATAVFDRSVIHSKSGGNVTAASTPQDAKGYLFVNSRLTAEPGLTGRVDLGRPWRPYANVVFKNTYMDDHIRPAGWNNWGNAANEATADYGEYLSYGPGANPAARVTWTKQLTKEEAAQYTVEKMLAGNDGWNPTAGTGLLNSNASLTGISVNGTPLPDFAKQHYDYVVTLPYGTKEAPQVNAAINVATSAVQLTQAAKLPGKAELKVTAQDGTQRIYNVSFEIEPDLVPPTATVSYSNINPTNQNVTATITLSEPVTITNNGGSATYTFSQNGSFTFEFMDEAGNKGTATATVSNIDKTAPVLTLIPDKQSLTPADHRLVSVHMSVYGEDEGSGVKTIVLTSITSNEPDNGLGDGDTAGDIAKADIGTLDTEFQLRAERSGIGQGRIYLITYTITDLAGNQTTTTAKVTVPLANN